MLHFQASLKKATKRLSYGLLLLCLICLLTNSRAPTAVEEIRHRGELRMVTLPGSTTYFDNAKGPSGFEFWLAQEFANYLGVRLIVNTRDTIQGTLIAVGTPVADFAAAGLTVTEQRKKHYRFSTPYYQVTQTLIFRNGNRPPSSLDDLQNGELLVIKQSAHSELLNSLLDKHPELRWKEVDTGMSDLMAGVDNGDITYAIVDSTAHIADRVIFPNARKAFDISEEQPIAWAFPRHGETSLLQAANSFLADMEDSGRLESLKNRIRYQTVKFHRAGSKLFIERLNTRLIPLLPLIQSVAEDYNIEWQLLAAIAYQESHWNPRAVSATGVRGLMMLTARTAKEMRVKHLFNPRESLVGGVKYYLQTKARIPYEIIEPDRTWFALAGYNLGLGHLEDGRDLTKRMGGNPNKWADVKKYLPLLEQKKYFSTVKYGYARGYEPVNYVKNVRYFHKILRRYSNELERIKNKEHNIQSEESHWPLNQTIPEGLKPL